MVSSCLVCDGSGYFDTYDAYDSEVVCKTCGGTGEVMTVMNLLIDIENRMRDLEAALAKTTDKIVTSLTVPMDD